MMSAEDGRFEQTAGYQRRIPFICVGQCGDTAVGDCHNCHC